MSKQYKSLLLLTCLCMALFFSGCATVSVREALPTYNINGIEYVSVVAFCRQRNVNWEYDNFSRTVNLTNGRHTVNLRVSDTIATVDGQTKHLLHPVDLYQGMIVLPNRFKEDVLDFIFRKETPSARPNLVGLGIRKVVIDAGHGGKDPGAIGRSGLREKDINLDIAKRLSRLLKDEGVGVVLTRSSDTFVSLERRVDIANRNNADLFVSIHSNANRAKSLNGVEVYYITPSLSVDSKRAQSSADDSSLDFESGSIGSSSSDLKAILWDMVYTANRAESIKLARSICNAIEHKLDTRVIGVKSANYFVLKGAQMPAVLIEVGFVSNAAEERLLKNGYYRQQIADVIDDGLHDYAHSYAFKQ